MKAEALEEWREHPVTISIKKALRSRIDREKAAGTTLYWAGQAWPEEKRLALLHEEALWGDMFEATAEDLEAELRTDE